MNEEDIKQMELLCISNIIKNKYIINRSLKGFKEGPEFPEFPACEGLNISCILEFFTSWLSKKYTYL